MEGTVHQHPYVPRDLQLPGFVPPFLSQSAILGVYGTVSLLVVSIVWLFSGFPRRKIAKLDRLLMCWWAFTGLTHLILEGYFAFAPEFYKDKSGFYLAEVWKEYSKGDSRYAARDAGVVSVEGLTAVLEGPACLLAVYTSRFSFSFVNMFWFSERNVSVNVLRNDGCCRYAIAAGKSYSYILQFAISLGQLYGTAVYFITSYLEGDNFAASPFYYYAYYIGANASWVVIPSLIALRCWRKTCRAFNVQASPSKKTKTR
ncbi:Probable 3-beta-hydroxysteroid-Delta(8),Delta(7)-isomerase [Linum grandiflorum]